MIFERDRERKPGFFRDRKRKLGILGILQIGFLCFSARRLLLPPPPPSRQDFFLLIFIYTDYTCDFGVGCLGGETGFM